MRCFAKRCVAISVYYYVCLFRRINLYIDFHYNISFYRHNGIIYGIIIQKVLVLSYFHFCRY